ncbi:excisionase [Variovorax paradoxus]|nr:excisionase [Variovorax paradoxus]
MRQDRPDDLDQGALGMPRKITLPAWAAQQFDPAPTENTLRAWARSGRIVPAPLKIGRTYWVEPTAKHIAEVMADNRLVSRLRLSKP